MLSPGHWRLLQTKEHTPHHKEQEHEQGQTGHIYLQVASNPGNLRHLKGGGKLFCQRTERTPRNGPAHGQRKSSRN